MAPRTTGWRRVEPSVRSPHADLPRAAGRSDPGTEGLTTFIDPDCQVEGKLVIRDSIRIDGEFRGAIESPRTVTVGEHAAIEATIQARTVIVHGAVIGEVRGTREVVLHPTARLQGNVETPSFVVERGAVFNGQTRMYRPDQRARARAPLQPDIGVPGPLTARS